MKKPIIGLTPAHNLENDDISMGACYVKAVQAAGGLPLTLPLDSTEEDISQIADLCDAFLFIGGPDIHPFYFGEDTQIHCGKVSQRRDSFEHALLPRVMERQKPILGICRGIQALNVFLGGDIYQDIPSQTHPEFPIAHTQPSKADLPTHRVTIKGGSLLASLCSGKREIAVNSFHHQGVRNLAPGLVATAWANDGLIEAVEKPDYPFFLGVQWHPERLASFDADAASLFSGLVNAANVH